MQKIEDVYPKWLINKVFIHELGHYIANLINSQNSELPNSNTIHFYPCTENNEELCGECKNSNPKKYNQLIKPKDLLAELIGSVIMGCIFQAYYLKSELIQCLNNNGSTDREIIRNAKDEYLTDEKMVALSALEDKFLEVLKQNNTLEFLNDLKPLNFIQNTETENRWGVDLLKLDEFLKNVDLQPFEAEYLAFLERLREVIYS